MLPPFCLYVNKFNNAHFNFNLQSTILSYITSLPSPCIFTIFFIHLFLISTQYALRGGNRISENRKSFSKVFFSDTDGPNPHTIAPSSISVQLGIRLPQPSPDSCIPLHSISYRLQSSIHTRRERKPEKDVRVIFFPFFFVIFDPPFTLNATFFFLTPTHHGTLFFTIHSFLLLRFLTLITIHPSNPYQKK